MTPPYKCSVTSYLRFRPSDSVLFGNLFYEAHRCLIFDELVQKMASSPNEKWQTCVKLAGEAWIQDLIAFSK
jgi:hypothetical protein